MNPADGVFVQFKSHVRATVIPAEAVYLVSENGQVTALSGSAIERLAPLLDGTRTLAQLMAEMSPYLSAAEVWPLLGRLQEAGLIKFTEPRPAGHIDDAQTSAYWDLAGIDADSARMAISRDGVRIIAVRGADSGGVATACRASGLGVGEPETGTSALTIVLCGDYLDPALDEVNTDHLASKEPWLLAKQSGPDLWIGPVFQPGSGPCWACLAKRLEGNRPGEFLIRRVLGAERFTRPGLAALPAGRAAGAELIALAAVKWLSGMRYEGQQDVCVLDTLTMRLTHHRVAVRPQCRSCGDPGLVSAVGREPVITVVRDAAIQEGNGLRAVGLDEVLRQYGQLIDPVTGIIGELRRDPQSPEFLYSYLSGRNRAMTEMSVAALHAGLRSHSGGKGATDLEAKVGALCEAVERYCGTLDGDELKIRDSYRNLGAQAVHPDACQLYDDRQFADRVRWNASCAPFHRVPEPFDERAVLDWTPMWSLLTGEKKLLPTSMLYFRPEGAPEQATCRADSNGNAAGTCLEDAIMQGAFELVERDAVAIWWYNRTRQPGVDLESFDDPWIAGVPELYRRLGREVWLLDVTSDLGIPVMAALSRRMDKPAEDIMFGFGAHFDPRIAARRALTELGQLLPSVVGAKAGCDDYEAMEPYLISWWRTATVRNQPYLLPDSEQVPRTAASYRHFPARSLDVGPICDIARNAGLDILVLDQTRPDIGMPVVKIVVPGLRHFWPRFAPGRLFQVPFSLGRLAEPIGYEQLNPIPLFV